jgi:prepilin-type N-terminal cleavage/methylation domain-containing protein
VGYEHACHIRKLEEERRVNLTVGKGCPVSGRALKNAGYTLLEMIVVVAILAVGLTIVGMSINTIFSLEMKQSVKELSSELGKEKVAAMTRTGEVYMRLYKTDSGIYIDKYEDDHCIEQGISVGSAKVTLNYCIGSNAAGVPLDEDGIIIAFNKSNGSFKDIDQAWKLFDDTYTPQYSGAYYTKLVLMSGGSSRTIVMWPDTGKFSITI